MALLKESSILEEIDEQETERAWRVVERISECKSDRQVCERLGKLTALKDGQELIKIFQIGKIITRVTARLEREDATCPPGAALEDIDEILQTHENSEALLYALFNYTASCVDKAFRYGYYAALEDEAD